MRDTRSACERGTVRTHRSEINYLPVTAAEFATESPEPGLNELYTDVLA